MYQTLIRPLLFDLLKTDPENLHRRSLSLLSWLETHQNSFLVNWLLDCISAQYSYQEKSLSQTLWGLTFPNPLGLAAGFDKDGVAASIWNQFGFGYAELGTVTQHPQPGNPRPRLFRLSQDQAVLNRMGFNNAGSEALANTLKTQTQKRGNFPWGINLGKSKVTPLEEAANDYLTSFLQLRELGDYFVVNVSSPNTTGLRSLQDPSQLKLILQAIQQHNSQQKPLLIKIAPDLSWDTICDVLTIANQYQLAGIIATNTTIAQEGLKTQTINGTAITEQAGGISGKPLRDRATDIIRFIYQQTGGTLPIIGVGGIFTADDAWEKITAGASLLQVYTGWIYQGPTLVPQVLKGLSQKLDKYRLTHISEAVGMANHQHSTSSYSLTSPDNTSADK